MGPSMTGWPCSRISISAARSRRSFPAWTRPMHLNVSYKTQDDIEVSLEIDYDAIVLRSVYYPEEDAYALEQMGKAVWMTHFRYGS